MTMNRADACNILGLSTERSLTKQEIERAYRMQSFKHHPDKNIGCSDDEKQEHVKQLLDVQKAYEQLSIGFPDEFEIPICEISTEDLNDPIVKKLNDASSILAGSLIYTIRYDRTLFSDSMIRTLIHYFQLNPWSSITNSKLDGFISSLVALDKAALHLTDGQLKKIFELSLYKKPIGNIAKYQCEQIKILFDYEDGLFLNWPYGIVDQILASALKIDVKYFLELHRMNPEILGHGQIIHQLRSQWSTMLQGKIIGVLLSIEQINGDLLQDLEFINNLLKYLYSKKSIFFTQETLNFVFTKNSPKATQVMIQNTLSVINMSMMHSSHTIAQNDVATAIKILFETNPAFLTSSNFNKYVDTYRYWKKIQTASKVIMTVICFTGVGLLIGIIMYIVSTYNLKKLLNTEPVQYQATSVSKIVLHSSHKATLYSDSDRTYAKCTLAN